MDPQFVKFASMVSDAAQSSPPQRPWRLGLPCPLQSRRARHAPHRLLMNVSPAEAVGAVTETRLMAHRQWHHTPPTGRDPVRTCEQCRPGGYLGPASGSSAAISTNRWKMESVRGDLLGIAPPWGIAAHHALGRTEMEQQRAVAIRQTYERQYSQVDIANGALPP